VPGSVARRRARETITPELGTPMHPAWLCCGKGYIQQVCAPFHALPGGRLDAPKPEVTVSRALRAGEPPRDRRSPAQGAARFDFRPAAMGRADGTHPRHPPELHRIPQTLVGGTCRPSEPGGGCGTHTPTENPPWCFGCPDCSCCGWPRARWLDCCSRSRRARNVCFRGAPPVARPGECSGKGRGAPQPGYADRRR